MEGKWGDCCAKTPGPSWSRTCPSHICAAGCEPLLGYTSWSATHTQCQEELSFFLTVQKGETVGLFWDSKTRKCRAPGSHPAHPLCIVWTSPTTTWPGPAVFPQPKPYGEVGDHSGQWSCVLPPGLASTVQGGWPLNPWLEESLLGTNKQANVYFALQLMLSRV